MISNRSVESDPPTYQEFGPPVALRPFLECSWILRASPQGKTTVKRVLPDGCTDLYAIDKTLTVAGPATRHTLVLLDPRQVAVGVRLRWGAAPAIFGLPANEIVDCVVPADSVWGKSGRRVSEVIFEQRDSSGKLSVIHSELRRRLKRAQGHAVMDWIVTHAAECLARRPDEMKVSDLADSLGLSERQLQRRFLHSVGYGPKRLARILRFQRLLALVHDHRPSPEWAALALDAGYADQAHMVNEVKALAGVSPTAFLSR